MIEQMEQDRADGVTDLPAAFNTTATEPTDTIPQPTIATKQLAFTMADALRLSVALGVLYQIVSNESFLTANRLVGLVTEEDLGALFNENDDVHEGDEIEFEISPFTTLVAAEKLKSLAERVIHTFETASEQVAIAA